MSYEICYNEMHNTVVIKVFSSLVIAKGKCMYLCLYIIFLFKYSIYEIYDSLGWEYSTDVSMSKWTLQSG